MKRDSEGSQSRYLSLFTSPRLSLAWLTLLSSVFMISFANAAFWDLVLGIFRPDNLHNTAFVISVFVLLVFFVNILLTLVCHKYLAKPVIIFLLITASLIAYFMDSYGVVIDRTMLRNVIETNSREAFDLVSPRMFVYLLLLGVIPSAFVYRTEILYRPVVREVLGKLVVIAVGIAVIGGATYLFFKDYASLARNNKQVTHLINPVNFIQSSIQIIKREIRAGDRTIRPVGTDAVLDRQSVKSGKRNLVILVIGETDRASNHSLDGYKRNTNPLLSKEDITYFSNYYSCGTATATSLPCMFSHLDQDSFSVTEGRKYENLVDIFRRAGLDVLWRENNAGCKGICDRIETDDLSTEKDPEFCTSEGCYDEILLRGLDVYLQKTKRDVVIVLHMNGSHGPSYYKRYPAEFRVFLPECRTNQLQDCAQQDVINTYDNTILYADYFLSKVIDFLRQQSNDFNTAMIYSSDHGESLGENNVYLHGLPYFMAPEEQIRVPFISWFSAGFRRTAGIDTSCLAASSNTRLTHDSLFHSMLGITGIKTKEYDPALDMFRDCRVRLR